MCGLLYLLTLGLPNLFFGNFLPLCPEILKEKSIKYYYANCPYIEGQSGISTKNIMRVDL